MKRLLTLVAFFATLQASAQQVNPVPDYVFANRMSAGRNTVTDTAAYFSIGPRYGATRGMMPPMVVDTASFSGNRRNGLLIFSVQKNKFLYWDSVGVKWAEMAGTGGTAISSGDTAAMLSPYVRHAGYGLTKSGQSFLIDTLNIGTRAWRQKGIDSLAEVRVGGSGTTNRIPKFTGSSTLGNSQIFDNGTNVGIGTLVPNYKLDIIGTTQSIDFVVPSDADGGSYIMNPGGNTASRSWRLVSDAFGYGDFSIQQSTTQTSTTYIDKLFINSSGEVLINTNVDNGDYKLQVNGNSLFSGNIRTAAPSGGTANDWRLGTVATVSPTSPNRTIEVSIGGTIYYIAAKTTND